MYKISITNKRESGFSALEAVFAILAIVLVGVVGGVLHKGYHNPTTASNNSAGSGVLIQLNDSGSTNTPPWQLTINKNGGGNLANNTFQNGRGISNGDKSYQAGTFAVIALENNLSGLNVNNLPLCSDGQYPPASMALGSASFGSVVNLAYHSKVITEFCQGNTLETAISKQLQSIISKANP